MGESDSESDSEEDEDERRTGIKDEEKEENSEVIDNGCHSDSSKEVDASSGSVAGRSNEQGSSENGSEEEGTEEPLKSVEGLDGNGNTPVLESPDGSEDKNGVVSPIKSHSSEVHEIVGQQPGSEDEVVSVAVIRDDSAPEAVSLESLEKPLNFDDYHSAAELEVCLSFYFANTRFQETVFS